MFYIQSLPKAFGDWYFDRKYWYVIDEHDLPISKKHEHELRKDGGQTHKEDNH